MFNGRSIAIATKHKKEDVIAPLLKRELNLNPVVPDIDTDILGTFSGEIKRELKPIEAARKKCMLAIKKSGCDLAIASEGSFGSHPSIFMANANEELVLLVDQKNNREYFGKSLTTETNLSGKNITNLNEAYHFCKAIGFPHHGVVIKEKEENPENIFKGITSTEDINKVFFQLLKKNQSIWMETDMRAMYNPTRMKNIKKATENLIVKLHSECPVCNAPGFWKSKPIKGLLCYYCNQPTKSIKAFKYLCNHCSHEEVKENDSGKNYEDPMYCDFCNP